MSRPSALLAGLLLLLISHDLPAWEPTVPEPSHELIDMAWWDQAMAESDSLIILEGLPHQLFEESEHVAESRRVPTLKLDNQLVYARPLDVSELDRRKLRETLGSGEAWVPPKTGSFLVKLCGGFHADYAITWARKDQPLATLLICFGCHELRFVDGERTITTDMTKEGFEKLWVILKEYRQERPLRRREKFEQLVPPLPKAEYPKVDYKP